jgi:signal transduction histidine kinase/ActR/RegA family two-component response regulator
MLQVLLPLNILVVLLVYTPLVFDYGGDWWKGLENVVMHDNTVIISYACVVAVAVPMTIDWALDIYSYYWRDLKELSSVHLTLRLLALAALIWPSIHVLYCEHGIELKYIICDYVAQKYFSMVLLLRLLDDLDISGGMKRLNAFAVVLMSAGVAISLGTISLDRASLRPLSILQIVAFSAYFMIHVSVLFSACVDYFIRKKGNGGSVLFISMFLVQATTLVLLRRASIMPTGKLSFNRVVIFNNFVTVCLCVIPTIMPGRVGRENFRDSKRINEFRQSFMRYISHEIRTPLNVSTVGVAIMEDTLAGSGHLHGEMGQIMEQTKKALGIATEILNDLLTFEKLSSNVMVLEQSLQRPVEYISSVVSLFEFQAKEKQIQLDLPCEDSCLANCFVFIDTYKMSQVLRNLVSNAIKFTPRGGSVTVTARVVLSDAPADTVSNGPGLFGINKKATVPSAEWLRISVSDSGAGIAPENICKLFKQIIQFDSNRLQNGGGSGLGMFISRGIVDLHGGRIHATSDGLDRGSTFSVDLPVVRAAEPPVQREENPTLASPSYSMDPKSSGSVSGKSRTDTVLTPEGRPGFEMFSGELDDIPEGSIERSPCNSIVNTNVPPVGVTNLGLLAGGSISLLNPHMQHSLLPQANALIDNRALPNRPTSNNIIDSSRSSTPKNVPSAVDIAVIAVSGRSLARPPMSNVPPLSLKSSIKQMFTMMKPSVDDEPHSSSFNTQGNGNSNYLALSSNASVSQPRVRNGSSLGSGSITPRSVHHSVASVPSSLYSDLESGKIALPGASSVPQTQLSTLDLRDYRILVVDDSNMNLKIMTLMIKKFGAECMTATNGDQAFKIITASITDDHPNSRIDMVVMDNHMDVMCGPVACKLMRSAGYAGPIFGLTGEVNAASDFEYMEAGADYIFRKPLNIKEVVDKFTAVFVR